MKSLLKHIGPNLWGYAAGLYLIIGVLWALNGEWMAAIGQVIFACFALLLWRADRLIYRQQELAERQHKVIVMQNELVEILQARIERLQGKQAKKAA